MGHDHHHHEPTNYNKAFAIGILLNIVFVVVEAIYGLLINSLALIADAGHNLSDVVSLILAWGASALAKKAATETRTYGYRKVTILASLLSAALLLVALGGIAWEAFGRLNSPEPIQGMTVIIVAGLGVLVNGVTAWLFVSGQKEDLNIRGAFLHMAADAAVSLGVVLAGIVIMLKGWLWIDPAMSLAIVVIIFIGTWGLLKDSLLYSIDAVPKGINVADIRNCLLEVEQVSSLHDLHIWPLSTTENALTVHLVVEDTSYSESVLIAVQHALKEKFKIAHSTIQIESVRSQDECQKTQHLCDPE